MITRLVASTYAVSGTVVVNQNESSLYKNVDNASNPARITHTTSGTSSYYLYIRGFNFSAIPDDAEVSSIAIKIKGYETSLATSTSYSPRLYNGTTAITGASAATSNFGTSTKTIIVPYTGTWSTLKSYGSDLGIRCTVRRSSRNTQGYLYIYGAEIEVTYTTKNYVKENGSWKNIGNVFIKNNNTWTKSTLANAIDATKRYVNRILS